MDDFPYIQGVSHSFIETDNVKFHIAEIGKGKPLVLIHGWPQHWYVWRKVIPLLKDNFRLIMLDLPGFGWSGMPKDNNFRKEKLADDIIELIDILNLKKVGLAGHDWGGWIGFLMCLKKPEKFSKYLAIGIGYPFSRSDSTINQSWRFLYQLPIATPLLGESLLRYLPSITEWGMRQCAYKKDTWTNEELRVFTSNLQNVSRAKASTLLYRTFVLEEAFSIVAGKYKKQKFNVLSHLMIGENDPIINPLLFRGMEETNSLKINFLKNCGHFIPEEKSELVAKEIKKLFG